MADLENEPPANGTYRARWAQSPSDITAAQSLRFQVFNVELDEGLVHSYDSNHRNFAVLNLLWKGIAAYARDHRARYLVGCSSLTSQARRSAPPRLRS